MIINNLLFNYHIKDTGDKKKEWDGRGRKERKKVRAWRSRACREDLVFSPRMALDLRKQRTYFLGVLFGRIGATGIPGPIFWRFPVITSSPSRTPLVTSTSAPSSIPRATRRISTLESFPTT